MGDQTRDDKPEPTLELPSLFRRRRRGTTDQQPAPEGEAKPGPEAAAAPPRQVPVEDPTRTAVADRTPDGRTTRERRAPRARRTGPPIPPSVAAPLTGLVVGLVGAVLTYGGLRGCELARGTDSCGDGPGGLLLLAIMVVMVLAGGALLAWLRVPDPRSTSFLGVGLTAVVAVVALLETLFSAWMFVVVPLVSAAAYLLAWWVSSRFVEQADDGPGVDVR
jgi:hypothetical protein